MTPDELVVIMLERLHKSKVDFTVENYATTRAATERLLRTVGAVPNEAPRAIEAPPLPTYVMPNPVLAADKIDERTHLLPIYRRGHREVHSGS